MECFYFIPFIKTDGVIIKTVYFSPPSQHSIANTSLLTGSSDLHMYM